MPVINMPSPRHFRARDIAEVKAVSSGEQSDRVRYLVELTREIEPFQIEPGKNISKDEQSALRKLASRRKAWKKLSAPAASILKKGIEALRRGRKPRFRGMTIQFGEEESLEPVKLSPEELRDYYRRLHDEQVLWNKKIVLSQTLGLATLSEDVDRADLGYLMGHAREKAGRIGEENMKSLLRNSAQRLANERGYEVVLTEAMLKGKKQGLDEPMWRFQSRVAADESKRVGRLEFGSAADELITDLGLDND